MESVRGLMLFIMAKGQSNASAGRTGQQLGSLGKLQSAAAAAAAEVSGALPASSAFATLEGKTGDSRLRKEARVQTRGK